MAQTKTIQLLRSRQLYVPTGEGANAKTALENAKAALTALTGRKDGEIVLARYQETEGSIKSVLGIYHANPDLPSGSAAGWTFIQDVTESQGSAAALQREIDTIESNVGLGTDGTYTSGYEQDDPVVGNPTTLKATVDAIVTHIKGLDQAARTNATTDGKVLVTLSQADGLVTETASDLTDVKMGGYSKTADTGAIAATDTLEQAFSKVENAIAANEVASADGSVTITQPTTGSSAGKTDLAVNVDGTTLVKNQSTGTISSALKVVKVIPSGTAGTDEVVDSNLATNVKEAYRLVYNGSTTAIGQQINVYKDSSLKEVYLGASTDTIDATTGTITKNTVTDPQSMNFAYQLADGTYSLVKIDVSKFLTESEFGDGLTVSGGVVSVEIDSTSGKVRTAATPSGATPGSAGDTGLVDVLSVSSDGVKVDNIQAAIDYAVQGATGDLAVSAQGDNYITAAVDANNNKKINVTADVQSLTATAGTVGVYDSTTGAQTTAPVAGTLSGVADSLGDAADIATKVKTYVDGAIAIEAARSDAKNLADLKTVVEGLDGTATASSATNLDTTPTADFKVLTKVAEVDGKVVETTVANGSTAVTLKKLAATGAAADVSIADAGGLITKTTVEGALQEIATNVRNNALVSNDVIVVTPDTTNNNTKLSVTTGNGLEKTGTNGNTLAVKQGDGVTVDANGVSVNAGDGLVIDNSGNVNVNTGDGLEIASDAVAIKIDPASAMADSTHGMLTVSSSGLKLNDTWDCGVF